MTLALSILPADARADLTPASLPASEAPGALPEAAAIDRRAPVVVEVRTDIDAPPAEVWRALAAAIGGPLVPGSTLARGVAGARVTAVMPERGLDWTANDRDGREMHSWRLVPHGAGTRLTHAQSIGGGLAAQDPRMVKEVLTHALRAWILAFKAEVEARPASRHRAA